MLRTGALSKALPAAGGGQLGEGAFKGYLAREKIDREKEKSGRAERYTTILESDSDIRQENQLFKREDREKEQSIMNGMVEASNEGGYEGVIDFLKQVDPERALKFDQGKKTLDASIMKNDVMKSTSKLTKDKALVESYGIMGKMGAAIMQAPEEERDAMYQQQKKLWKTVLPDASETWDAKMQNNTLLAMNQALPASLAIKYGKEEVKLLGRQGAIVANRIALEKVKNRTAGQESALKTMRNAEAKINDDALSASLKRQDLEAKEKYQEPLAELPMKKEVSRVKRELDKDSKAYVDFRNSTTGLDAAADLLRENKLAGKTPDYVSAAMVARQLAKMASGPGTMTDRDVDDTVSSETSHKTFKKYVKALVSGDMTKFSQKQVDTMLKVYDKIMHKKELIQRNVEDRYRHQYSKNGNMEEMYNKIRTPLQARQYGRDKAAYLRTLNPKEKAMTEKAMTNGLTLDQAKQGDKAIKSPEGQKLLQRLSPEDRAKAKHWLRSGKSPQEIEAAIEARNAKQQRR